jgi:hypothetical protein
MAYVVATRLHAQGWPGARRALALTSQVARQLSVQPGFLGGRLLADRTFTFWTLSVWADRAALAAFREGHATVAVQAPGVIGTDPTRMVVTGWVQHDDYVPSWTSAAERLPGADRPRRGLTRRLPAGPARIPDPTADPMTDRTADLSADVSTDLSADRTP